MVKRLSNDYAQFNFSAASQFSWSPSTNTINYPVSALRSQSGMWSLLHELGHAILGHTDYASDLELLKIERAAWDEAQKIAANYAILIDYDHVENCMDTYREWLIKRSRCPVCSNTSLQLDINHYSCFNCGSEWRVPRSQACRITRQAIKNPSDASRS
ncbi:MAG TPA: ImmA/IrrE family metallo-endopeptidase [Candidatus Saccharimonadales bacterium]